jgi:protoheme ferro-lyase
LVLSELREVLEVIEKILDQGGSTLVIVNQVPFYSREDSQKIFDELKRLLDESKELGSQKRPKEKSEEKKSYKQVSNKTLLTCIYIFIYLHTVLCLFVIHL